MNDIFLIFDANFTTMIFDKNIFRAYDIRGKAISDKPQITEEFALQLGKALGTYFLRRNMTNFACARDGRLTSESLQSALIQGLVSTGIQVTNLGLSPSPMFYFAVCQPEFDCGCVVTASHNPKDDNGFKIVSNGAHSVWGDELQKIYQLILDQDYEVADTTLDVAQASVFDRYVSKLHTLLDLKRPLKVVLDTGNGIAGPFVDKIFNHPMIDLHVIFQDIDGNFPNHPANPEKAANMMDLSKKVVELGADIGFGFDGDADRLGIVDQNGKFYTCDLLLMVLAEDFLSRNPGEVVIFDTKVSKVVENKIVEYGGKPFRYMTGHSLIEKQMHQDNIKFGGEISGHYFFGENYYGFDDAFLGALRFLSIFSTKEHAVSGFFDKLPHVFVTPEVRIDCADDHKFAVVEETIKNFESQFSLKTLDGMFLEFNDHTWGVCRASNTAGQLTLRFESQSKQDLFVVIDLISDFLDTYDFLDVTAVRELKTLF